MSSLEGPQVFEWSADVNRHFTFSPRDDSAWDWLRPRGGRPLAPSWRPLETVITPGGRKSSQRFGDLPCLSSDLPVLSERAVDALRDLLEPAGELLEIQPPPGVDGRFQVFNVTRVLDAFDRAKCDADWVEGGGMWNFRRLAFRPETIAGIPIFRTQGLVGRLMVQAPFLERVTQAGLMGFAFIPHWPELGPELFPNPPVPKRKRSG